MTNSIGRLVIRASGEVGIEGGGMLAVVYPVAECPQSKIEHASRARRIVACVNALQHVSTEQLETGELLNLSQRLADAERQRDALLAALENAADSLERAEFFERAAEARAHIAAAKGGAV